VEGNPYRENQVLDSSDPLLHESFQPIIGQAVTLRPLQRDDVDIESVFLNALSHESRHNRLLGGMIRITREYLEKLTTVDFSKDVALAATVMLDDRETLIGVARYVRTADACEFAIVIADDWQGKSIGRRLMQKLIGIARSRGLREIYGEILSSNRRMLEFCRTLGFSLGRSPEDATVTRATLQL
jgi:acetyltransferase